MLPQALDTALISLPPLVSVPVLDRPALCSAHSPVGICGLPAGQVSTNTVRDTAATPTFFSCSHRAFTDPKHRGQPSCRHGMHRAFFFLSLVRLSFQRTHREHSGGHGCWCVFFSWYCTPLADENVMRDPSEFLCVHSLCAHRCVCAGVGSICNSSPGSAHNHKNTDFWNFLICQTTQ